MSFAKVAPEFDRFLENFIHYELTKDEHPQVAHQSAATNDVSDIKKIGMSQFLLKFKLNENNLWASRLTLWYHRGFCVSFVSVCYY